MIDLHCHILFDTDDGSKNIEESIQMAKEAYESGFTEICATPHYLAPQFACNVSKNQQTLNALQNALNENNIPIKLYLGNEIYINDHMVDLIESGETKSLGDSDYVLFELPLWQRLDKAQDIIRGLPYDHLILAHPERYTVVQRDIHYLDEFIEMGVLLQCNYESITGKYGLGAKKVMKKLLKKKMVSLLSTDCHRPGSTYSKMDEINKKLLKTIKQDYFEELTDTNPRIILGI